MKLPVTDPAEVNTVSKRRVSVEIKILASGLVINSSFLQAMISVKDEIKKNRDLFMDA